MIRIDLVGVAEYQADLGPIEAQELFAADGFAKRQRDSASNGFDVALKQQEGTLTFPNIHGLGGMDSLVLHMVGESDASFELSVSRRGADAPIVKHRLKGANRWRIPLGPLGRTESLIITVKRGGPADWKGELALDRISFE